MRRQEKPSSNYEEPQSREPLARRIAQDQQCEDGIAATETSSGACTVERARPSTESRDSSLKGRSYVLSRSANCVASNCCTGACKCRRRALAWQGKRCAARNVIVKGAAGGRTSRLLYCLQHSLDILLGRTTLTSSTYSPTKYHPAGDRRYRSSRPGQIGSRKDRSLRHLDSSTNRPGAW